MGPVRIRHTTLDKKKRTTIEIRGEKNAVPRVISWSIRRDQRRASPIRDCPRLLPCAGEREREREREREKERRKREKEEVWEKSGPREHSACAAAFDFFMGTRLQGTNHDFRVGL